MKHAGWVKFAKFMTVWRQRLCERVEKIYQMLRLYVKLTSPSFSLYIVVGPILGHQDWRHLKLIIAPAESQKAHRVTPLIRSALACSCLGVVRFCAERKGGVTARARVFAYLPVTDNYRFACLYRCFGGAVKSEHVFRRRPAMQHVAEYCFVVWG